MPSGDVPEPPGPGGTRAESERDNAASGFSIILILCFLLIFIIVVIIDIIIIIATLFLSLLLSLLDLQNEVSC